jgi:hypothetical protein
MFVNNNVFTDKYSVLNVNDELIDDTIAEHYSGLLSTLSKSAQNYPISDLNEKCK